jgi:hypothetical protein
MKNSMKIQIVAPGLMLPLLLATSALSYGQAVPAGVVAVGQSPGSTAPNLSALDGVVHYAISASEVVQYGYYGTGEVSTSTVLSGDIAYNAKSVVKPFSLIFAGGLLLPNGNGQGLTTFQNVGVSQGYVTRNWIFNINDSFSFLPESPTTGLSGVAGVGDIGVVPVTGPVIGPAGGVLSTFGNRVSNYLSGSVERTITRETSVSGSGSYGILHFLDVNGQPSDGLDSSQISGVVALNHRINARSSASVNAVYSTFSYSGPEAGAGTPNFLTKGINVSYQRVLSHTLSFAASAGPQWTTSSDSALIPSTLSVAASASLTYSRRFTNAVLSYTRGVNSGSGVLPGSLSDSISIGVGRSFGRNWAASASGAYTRTSGITELPILTVATPVHEQFDTLFGGLQLNRRISSNLSAYVSYSAQDQSTNYSLGSLNALSGTSQTFGVGITFSPRSTRLGQF